MPKLSVLIGGDDRELQRALKRAQSSMRKMGTEFRASANVAAKWAAGIAVAATAASAAMVSSAMKAIDAQAKQAQQLRTTVASMAVLEAASATSGVSVEQMATGIRTMNVNLADASAGTGQAAKSIKRLGLDLAEVAALPVDQRIALINQRINDLIPVTERAGVAADIFGSRAGQAMSQLSPEVIREAAADAERFGLALSDVDARKVELANDAMERAQMVGQGFLRQVAVKLAPVIDDLAKRFLAAANEAGGMGVMAADAAAKIVTATGFVMDAGDGVRRVFVIAADAIIIAMAGAEAAMRRLLNIQLQIARFNPLARMLFDIPKALQDNNAAMKEAEGVIGEAIDHIRDVLEEPMPSVGIEAYWQRVQASAQAAAEASVKASQAAAVGGTGTGVPGEDKEQTDFEKRLEALRSRFVTEEEAIREHNQVLEDLARAQREGKLETDEEFYAMVEEAARAHEERVKQIKERGLTDQERFARMSLQRQAQTVFGELANMTAGVAQNNKTLFNINKAAAIAEALLGMRQHIALTMSKFPYPLSIAMGAAAGASSLAQVAAIRSQSFSGGGAGAAPSVAGSTPAPPVTPVSGGGATQQTQSATINVVGDVFDRKTVIGLMEEVNKLQKDGVRLDLRVA